jgi:transcriptional regulator with XRE-family HTH domain
VRRAKELFEELRAEDPAIQEAYDRLGPRFELISALIKARKQSDLSQRELAERIGVTKTVISRLESGEHSPRLETVYDVAKALGYRLDVKLVRERSKQAKAS